MRVWVIKKSKKYDNGWGNFGPLFEAHLYRNKKQLLQSLTLCKGERVVEIEMKEKK